MEAIRTYTDLEQSKKLAEILPLESADMYYISGDEYYICFGSGIYEEIVDWLSDGTPRPADIPCWSLATLLSVIPNYKLSSEHNYHTCTAVTSFGKETVGWFNNPVDACVEMILKLKEKNLL